MVQTVVDLLIAHGYLALFGLLMFGIIGIPVPDEFLMSYAGAMVYEGRLLFVPVVLCAWLGACSGISVSYVLGRTLGVAASRRFLRWRPGAHDMFDRVMGWMPRGGRWLVMFGYFVPGVRHLSAIVAGTSKMRFHTFMVFAWGGALVWAVSYTVLGFYLGKKWLHTSARVHQIVFLIAGAAVGAWLLFLLVRRMVRKARHA